MWTSPDLEGGVPGLRPSTWGYNCAVEACAKAGDWGAAVELMREMEDRGESRAVRRLGSETEDEILVPSREKMDEFLSDFFFCRGDVRT